MIIYKRNIGNRLLSLRLSFFILCLICFLAFIYSYDKLGYFIALTLATMRIIVVKGFIIYLDSFQVSKFYFFGLFKRKWHFNKSENIRVLPLGSDFGEDGVAPNVDDGGSGLGCLFSIFSMFSPPTITKKEYKVENLNETNDKINSTRILLDRPELNYLDSFIRRP